MQFYFFPILLGFLLTIACGDQNDLTLELEHPSAQQTPIINGERCTETTHPSAAAIMSWLKVEFDSWLGLQEMRVPSCSGILIAPDTILTAAHCLDPKLLPLSNAELLDSDYYVTFQPDLSVYADYPGTPFPDDAIKARKIVAHPDFDINALQGVAGPGDFADVGLIFLEKPITHVEPAIIITPEESDQLRIRTAVEIAGWGMSQPDVSNQDPNAIGTAGVKYCAESEINELGEKEMQIGSDTFSSRKCHGDSGGPTYMKVNSATTRYDRVVGITSHSYDASNCYRGGVDTRIDVWYTWIDEQMQAHCANGTRPWCDVTGIIPPEFYDPKAPEVESGFGCTQSRAQSFMLPFVLVSLFVFRLTRRKKSTSVS